MKVGTRQIRELLDCDTLCVQHDDCRCADEPYTCPYAEAILEFMKSQERIHDKPKVEQSKDDYEESEYEYNPGPEIDDEGGMSEYKYGMGFDDDY